LIVKAQLISANEVLHVLANVINKNSHVITEMHNTQNKVSRKYKPRLAIIRNAIIYKTILTIIIPNWRCSNKTVQIKKHIHQLNKHLMTNVTDMTSSLLLFVGPTTILKHPVNLDPQ